MGRVALALGAEMLAEVLGLPEGVRVVGVETSANPVGATFVLEGDVLPPVPGDMPAPLVVAHTKTLRIAGVLEIDWPSGGEV